MSLCTSVPRSVVRACLLDGQCLDVAPEPAGETQTLGTVCPLSPAGVFSAGPAIAPPRCCAVESWRASEPRVLFLLVRGTCRVQKSGWARGGGRSLLRGAGLPGLV